MRAVPHCGVERFAVTDVDEFRTCNKCMGELKSETANDRTLDCVAQAADGSKQFGNRDVNTAANILLVGMSAERPAAMSRRIKHHAEDTECYINVKKPTVSAVGQSSDPASFLKNWTIDGSICHQALKLAAFIII